MLLRHDFGLQFPLATPKAFLQLERTPFPSVADCSSIFSNLISVQATLLLQSRLIATSVADVPVAFKYRTSLIWTPVLFDVRNKTKTKLNVLSIRILMKKCKMRNLFVQLSYRFCTDVLLIAVILVYDYWILHLCEVHIRELNMLNLTFPSLQKWKKQMKKIVRYLIYNQIYL